MLYTSGNGVSKLDAAPLLITTFCTVSAPIVGRARSCQRRLRQSASVIVRCTVAVRSATFCRIGSRFSRSRPCESHVRRYPIARASPSHTPHIFPPIVEKLMNGYAADPLSPVMVKSVNASAVVSNAKWRWMYRSIFAPFISSHVD